MAARRLIPPLGHTVKLLVHSLLIVAVLVLADQGAKILVRLHVPLHQSSPILPHLLDLTHVQNKGVSFSFLGNLAEGLRVPLLITISVLALLVLFYYWWRHRDDLNSLSHLAFQCIVAGAIGNLIDRSLYGAVTDFFHFRFYATSFFVNNIADILISAGVVAYLLGMVRASSQRRRAEP
jgi:signal peptidase II